MDIRQAQRALDEIRAREEQALDAAHPRLPWWVVAGRAGFFLLLGVGLDVSDRGHGVLYAALFGAAGLLYALVHRRLERRAGVRVRPSFRTGRQIALGLAEAGAIMTVFILASVVSYLVDLPVHGVVAGIAAAVAAALLAQPFQRARHAMLSRR
ncbi:hypothetical protein ACQEU3_06110 [Spirillospora sp. CA-253888]